MTLERERVVSLATAPLRELGRTAHEIAGLIEARAAQAQTDARELLEADVTPSELLETLIEMAYQRGAAHALEVIADMLVDAAEQMKPTRPLDVLIRDLAADPCPRCGGNVIASETDAVCAAGCGWSYRRNGATA